MPVCRATIDVRVRYAAACESPATNRRRPASPGASTGSSGRHAGYLRACHASPSRVLLSDICSWKFTMLQASNAAPATTGTAIASTLAGAFAASAGARRSGTSTQR